MNIKLAVFSVAAVAVGVVALSSSSVFAYQGDYTAVGPNHTEERAASMEAVMSAGDFEGWKQLMSEDGRTPGVLRKIDTLEEFQKFAEAYTLGKAGKTEEANALRQELGLGNGGGNGRGQHGNRSNFSDANGDGVCDRME